jgi:hypothetical protein
MTSTETLGALKYEIAYADAPGDFAGSALEVSCTPLVTSASASFFDDDTGRKLSGSFIALAGFTGPVDLSRCTFTTSASSLAASSFALTVLDASTTRLEPATPTLAVSVACSSSTIAFVP